MIGALLCGVGIFANGAAAFSFRGFPRGGTSSTKKSCAAYQFSSSELSDAKFEAAGKSIAGDGASCGAPDISEAVDMVATLVASDFKICITEETKDGDTTVTRTVERQAELTGAAAAFVAGYTTACSCDGLAGAIVDSLQKAQQDFVDELTIEDFKSPIQDKFRAFVKEVITDPMANVFASCTPGGSSDTCEGPLPKRAQCGTRADGATATCAGNGICWLKDNQNVAKCRGPNFTKRPNNAGEALECPSLLF